MKNQSKLFSTYYRHTGHSGSFLKDLSTHAKWNLCIHGLAINTGINGVSEYYYKQMQHCSSSNPSIGGTKGGTGSTTSGTGSTTGGTTGGMTGGTGSTTGGTGSTTGGTGSMTGRIGMGTGSFSGTGGLSITGGCKGIILIGYYRG